MSERRFSFSRLLHNDRIMMVVSLLVAIGLWYVVFSGSANITTRTITCTLTPANVRNGALQVIDTEPIVVDVEVQGAWSDVNKLSADDIRVQLNASDIQNAGNCRIHVLASRNSQANDYDILSTSPATVTLFCDEWSEGKEFSVEAGTVTVDAPGVTAQGDNLDIGTASVDALSLPGGIVSVQGPLSVVNKIDRIAVRVADTTAITSPQTFAATIAALDENGEEVDLTYCTLRRYDVDPKVYAGASLTDMTENALNVLITVNQRQNIVFEYDIKNAPAGIDLSQIVSMEPASIQVEGDQSLLAQYAESIAKLTTVDFDTLSTAERTRVISLKLPDGITVVGTGANELEVTMSFDWSGYSGRTITWNIGPNVTESPITFHHVPTDKTINMLTRSFSVQVFGKRETVQALTVADLQAVVDMSNSSLGTFAVRPTVSKDDVWVYYGESGYTLYLDIK